MATTIGTAYVQILPTTEGITSQLTSALTGATDEAGQASGASFGSAFGTGMLGVVGTIASAAAATIGAVVSGVNEISEAGDAIDKTSQQVGVSAEQFQALQFAAEHCGFNVSTFQTAARNLADTEFDGNIYDAINSIMQLDDVEQRTALATELFGERAAQAMAPLINGTQSADDYAASLEALGGMMSNEAVANAAAYQDALTDMNTAFDGLKTSMLQEFMPSMTQVMEGVSQLLAGNKEGLDGIKEGIQGFLDSLLEAAPQLVETAGELAMSLVEGLLESLPQILEVGAEVILKLASGISESLPSLIPTLVEVIIQIVDGLINNMEPLVEGALQLIIGLATGLIKAIPTLITYIPEIIEGIVGALIDCIPDLWDAGVALIEGLAQGIVDSVGAVIESVVNVANEIIGAVKGFFGIHSPSRLFRDEIGENLMLGLAQGITDNEDAVEDALGDVEALTTGALTSDLSLTGNYAASGAANLSGAVAALAEKVDQLANSTKYDFYIDGKRMTDAVTLRQRRMAVAGG